MGWDSEARAARAWRRVLGEVCGGEGGVGEGALGGVEADGAVGQGGGGEADFWVMRLILEEGDGG